MDAAAARPDPIPCFCEMSSGNPVFMLPSALSKAPVVMAKGLFGSFTLGAGQMCTKPGVVFVTKDSASHSFLEELRTLVEQAQPFTLLTGGIAREYDRTTQARSGKISVAAEAQLPLDDQNGAPYHVAAKLFTAALDVLMDNPELSDEVFGPDTLVVNCERTEDYLRAARSLSGHLTASIFGDEEDLAAHRELIEILEQKAGRLIFNGFPTGVEVAQAMIHGGPYPSTSDPRFTSVGGQAIYRFARPVCFQNFPQTSLPPELQDGNPLKIWRLRNGSPEEAGSA